MGLASKQSLRLAKLAAMRVKVGDKVQSDEGLEGEVIGYTPDGYSAFVRLPGTPGRIVTLPLISLTKVDDDTRESDRTA